MNSQSTRRLISLAAALLLLVLLHLVRPATSSYWLETVFDWLHVPVFACVAIGLFHAFGDWRSNVNKSLLAFSTCILLAVLSEAAQIPTSRDASWADIISNVTGAAIGLLAIPTVTDRIHVKILGRMGALILLVISALPVITVTLTYIERDKLFPVIYNEVWPRQTEFMSQEAMTIDFRNVHPDWRGYRSLALDIEVFTTEAFNLTVRVHDRPHLHGRQPYSDRFNRQLSLESGRSIIEIPLADVEAGPAQRSMDLSKIDGLVLFSEEDERRHNVRLHRIWLR